MKWHLKHRSKFSKVCFFYESGQKNFVKLLKCVFSQKTRFALKMDFQTCWHIFSSKSRVWQNVINALHAFFSSSNMRRKIHTITSQWFLKVLKRFNQIPLIRFLCFGCTNVAPSDIFHITNIFVFKFSTYLNMTVWTTWRSENVLKVWNILEGHYVQLTMLFYN